MLRTRVVLGAALLAAVWACDDAPPPFELGGSAAEPEHLGEPMFREIQADVLKACGSCHQQSGSADTPFLGNPETNDPDPYDAITSWPGIIVKEADDSLLITWPRYGQHTGGPTDPVLEERLIGWLAEEAKGIDADNEGKPTIPPFKPIVPGFNAVYLDALGPDFGGMAVTFMAEELTPTALSFTDIEVHPTSKLGLRLEHPLFTVYPAGSADGDPDPVDSFSNVVQEIEAGLKAPLGPGTMVLTNWQSGGKISLNFAEAVVVDPDGGAGGTGGGPSSPCSALEAFENNARGPLLDNCVTCHGGANQAASNAVDMTELEASAATACGQVRTRVNPDNPPQSQIFITTDPNGNASHPFKFGGNVNAFNAFRSAVSIWIQAEAP